MALRIKYEIDDRDLSNDLCEGLRLHWEAGNDTIHSFNMENYWGEYEDDFHKKVLAELTALGVPEGVSEVNVSVSW